MKKGGSANVIRFTWAQSSSRAASPQINRRLSKSDHLLSTKHQMKTTLTLMSLVISIVAQAANITFIGVVDTVQPNSRFEVGDRVQATFVYNGYSGEIALYMITVANETWRGTGRDIGQVTYDSNPLHGSVFYQVVNSWFMEFTLQAGTPDGVIPPIEQFNLNDFVLFGAFGHMTQLPMIR